MEKSPEMIFDMTQSTPKEFAKLPVVEREERNLSLSDEPAQFASALDFGVRAPDPDHDAAPTNDQSRVDD